MENDSTKGSSHQNASTVRNQRSKRILTQYRQAVNDNIKQKIKSLDPLLVKPTFLNTMIGGSSIIISIPPYIDNDNGPGLSYVELTGFIKGISRIESDGDPKTREYFLEVRYEPLNFDRDNETVNGTFIPMFMRPAIFGVITLIVNENDQLLDISSGYQISGGFSGFFIYEEETFKLTSKPLMNCPRLYNYDFDKDGIDEVLYFDSNNDRGRNDISVYLYRKVNRVAKYERFCYDIISSSGDWISHYSKIKPSILSDIGVTVTKEGIEVNTDSSSVFSTPHKNAHYLR